MGFNSAFKGLNQQYGLIFNPPIFIRRTSTNSIISLAQAVQTGFGAHQPQLQRLSATYNKKKNNNIFIYCNWLVTR